MERCLHGEGGGCEASGPGPGPGAQLAGRGRQPPSLSPPSARPRSNIFCLWNKTSQWYARLDHPGRRALERSFQKDEPRPQQASAQPGRLSGLVGLGRPHPCPSHGADSPGGSPPPEGSAGGARIVSSDLGSPAARGCFHRPQSASRSVTCLQVSTGFCQRRGAAPPWAQPRRWQLRDRESRRAGGVPGSRASRARGSAPSLRPRGLRAFSLASSTLSPPSPTAPRTARLSPPQAGPPRVPRPVFHPYPGVAGRRL